MLHRTAWLAPLCLLVGCSDSALDVRGDLDRVIGERTTLHLEQGEPGFNGDLELTDAADNKFGADALQVQPSSSTQLSFVVPAGVRAGQATAWVGKQGGGVAYDVPLTINRLAVAALQDGTVELLPLPPATLARTALPLSPTAGAPLTALTASGGRLAVASDSGVTFFDLGASPTEGTSLTLQGPLRHMVGLPGGVLACSDTEVHLLRPDDDPPTISAPLSGCRRLAVNAKGGRAVALTTCDSDSDGTDEDCLVELSLEDGITALGPISLDDSPGATHLAMRRDGRGALVVDSDAVYGVWLDAFPPTPVVVPWGPGAQCGGVSQTIASEDEIFAVADATASRVVVFGFDGEVLKPFVGGEVPLPARPDAVAYGLDARLYVASGSTLYAVGTFPPGAAQQLSLQSSADVAALQVQP